MRTCTTRRQFLKQAGGSTMLAPLIMPARLFGAERPSNRVTMACIGVGGRGMGNMNAFLNDPRVEVIAVCDVDSERAAAAARRVEAKRMKKSGAASGRGACTVTADYRELVQRNDIDTVMIGTPDHTHALIAVNAARHGKDVYCEKPLAYSVAEGQAMVRAVRQFGRVLQTGTQRRSNGRIRQACEAVRNGRIGKLERVKVGLPRGFSLRHGAAGDRMSPEPIPEGFDYDKWLGPAPRAPYCKARCHFNFRWILDYGEGYISDWGAHYMDVAHWGMGADESGPVTVAARATFPDDGLYDAPTDFHMVYSYRDDVEVVCATDVALGIRFEGTEGWIHIEKPGAPVVSAGAGDVLSEPAGPGECHLYRSTNHHANFIDSVLLRHRTAAPVEVGHSSAAACHLGMIAARLGRPLRWDARTQRIVDDEGATRLLGRPMRHPWTL